MAISPGVMEATVTTIYPSAGALAADNNIRIASLTLGAYEYVPNCRSRASHRNSRSLSYLITLPAEYRLYKSSNRRR